MHVVPVALWPPVVALPRPQPRPARSARVSAIRRPVDPLRAHASDRVRPQARRKCAASPSAAAPSASRRSPRRTEAEHSSRGPGQPNLVRDDAARPASGAISIAAEEHSAPQDTPSARLHSAPQGCPGDAIDYSHALGHESPGRWEEKRARLLRPKCRLPTEEGSKAIGWANYNVIEEKRREEQRRKKIEQLLHKARCVNNAAEGQKILTELEKALEGSLAPTKGDEDIWSTCEGPRPVSRARGHARALRAAIATLRKVLKNDDFP